MSSKGTQKLLAVNANGAINTAKMSRSRRGVFMISVLEPLPLTPVDGTTFEPVPASNSHTNILNYYLLLLME